MTKHRFFANSSVRNSPDPKQKLKALVKDASASYRVAAKLMDMSLNKAWRALNHPDLRDVSGRPPLLNPKQDKELIAALRERAKRGSPCTMLELRQEVSTTPCTYVWIERSTE
jgi:hypothetical protein